MFVAKTHAYSLRLAGHLLMAIFRAPVQSRTWSWPQVQHQQAETGLTFTCQGTSAWHLCVLARKHVAVSTCSARRLATGR